MQRDLNEYFLIIEVNESYEESRLCQNFWIIILRICDIDNTFSRVEFNTNIKMDLFSLTYNISAISRLAKRKIKKNPRS